MKILFWSDGFWPRIGGIETQAFQFIEAMQKRGHQFLVLAQKDASDWKEEETYRGISIKRFDFNSFIAHRDVGVIRSIRDYLEQAMKEFQPEMFHLYSTLGGCAFAFLLFIKWFRAPIVATAHAPYLFEGQVPSVIKNIASSADRICCVSNWVLEEMKKHFPAHGNKLRMIYNGLPMPEITPSPLSFSPPTLLLFGRLAREKGFDTAIRAFSLLKQGGSNAKLVVAGGGPERLSLEKLAHELGLDSSVSFTGVLTPDEVLSTYNRASLVIVPSVIESFGLVILEAMQLQRPIIASAIEGIPEVIADGETGLLVPGKNPAALCQAIQMLLSHPEKAIRMGEEGRKRAMRFTIEQNALQYEALYRELL